MCDYTISVLCPQNVRMERIIKRDIITKQQAQSRINAQHNDDYYIKRCDFTINNNSSLENLYKQTEDILKKI